MENNITYWKELKRAELSGIGKGYLLLPLFLSVLFLPLFFMDQWLGIFFISFISISTLFWIIIFNRWAPNKFNNDSEILYLKYPNGKILSVSCEQIIDIDPNADWMYGYDTYVIKYFPKPTSKLDEALYIDAESGQEIEEWYNKYKSNTPEPSMR